MSPQFQDAAKAGAWFERLALELNLPDAKYEAAERSYRSVSAWMGRADSSFIKIDYSVYTQGSFRLGTAIEPFNKDEDYDLDIVCEFSLSKYAWTQHALHEALGKELVKYAERYGMQAPSPWDRCWTLNYADETKFHMDVLPCVPDGKRQRELRESQNISLAHVDQAVSITDRRHQNYRDQADEWPSSNPNGYAAWFFERMKPAFDARRQAMMLVEDKADVADIPEFRVRTPLQLAIQILKRHRDVRFADGETVHRPTSIVITTLAALAYQQEASVMESLIGILARMEQFIVQNEGRYFVQNPSDPRENFADSWNEEPGRAEVFYDWIETAKIDFNQAADGKSVNDFIETLAPRMGRDLVESASQKSVYDGAPRHIRSTFQRLIDAPHRKPPTWPLTRAGNVVIESAEVLRNGFRPRSLLSNESVEKGASLTFRAATNIPAPFKVYWQIVNTGDAARVAHDLRGTFETPKVEHGHLLRRETAKYPGEHSLECFIVKDGFCVARSGLYVVRIV